MSPEQTLEVFVDAPESAGELGEIFLKAADGGSSLAAYFGPAKELGHRLNEWGFEGLGRWLGRQKSKVAYLSGIQVDPSVRRRGIGSLMILRLLRDLEGRKVRQLLLHAQGTPGTPLEVLEAFYGRLGFEAVDVGFGDIYPVYRLDVPNA